MVTVGYWYVRNLLLSGNPLYPVQVELFGRTVLTGWYAPEVMKGSRYYIDPRNWRAGVDILLQVLDPRLAPLWIGAIAGFWAIGGRRDRDRSRWGWSLAALAVVNAAIYWGMIPYRTQQRFLFPAVGLAAVTVALLLDRARWLRVVGVVLLALHAANAPGVALGRGRAMRSAVPWDLSPVVANTMAGPIALTVPSARWWASLSDGRGRGAVGGRRGPGVLGRRAAAHRPAGDG